MKLDENVAFKDLKYDLLFKNLNIIDGSGLAGFYGDIAIKADTIACIGKCSAYEAREVIDCQGFIATPGFIDIHNHSDESLFRDGKAKNYTSQGVTTLVVGNCGFSAAPITEKNCESAIVPKDSGYTLSFPKYMDELDQLGKAVNVAVLVGHGNIRGSVIGMNDVSPTENEMAMMKDLVKECMEAGAFGLSSGLIYDPGIFTEVRELVELSKIVATYNGIYASHIRNESEQMIDAVLEAIQIGKASGVKVQISHHKVCGKDNWGQVKTSLGIMDYYRKQNLDISCDVYPCIYGNTDLYSSCPFWIRDMGHEVFLERLKDPYNRLRLKNDLSKPGENWENIVLSAGFDHVIISKTDIKDWVGKSIEQIGVELNCDDLEAMFTILEQDPFAEIIVGGILEDDMRQVLKYDHSMVGSDGEAIIFNEGMPHPRSYRAFTKVLANYVRDESLLTLEQGIQKMSYLAAQKLGLLDRGLIKTGFKADLAIFDMEKLQYESVYTDPHHYSKGMVHVVVNGQFVIRNNKFTENKSGRLLRKTV